MARAKIKRKKMYYKDNINKLYVFQEGALSEAEWKINTEVKLSVTLTSITEAEFQAMSNPPKTTEQIVAHYKSLYLGIVQSKLDELDYDSLATVKLWEGDATFGAEATRILTWYKAIILKNYQLLAAGVPMTDEEYLASINAIVF